MPESLKPNLPSELPKDCGQRLLPTYIDELARSDPDRLYVSVPRSTDIKDGFRDVSFQTFANAINRCAWWIEKTLGRSDNFETLAYLGPQDLRYCILVVAAIKTGHKMFFTSPRISLEAHLALLESLECKTFLQTDQSPTVVENIVAKREMHVVTVSSLDDFLAEDLVPIYAFSKNFDQAKYEPFVVLHTSGSTGIPKPITLTHGAIATTDAYRRIPFEGGEPTVTDYWRGKKTLMCFPFSHGAGLLVVLAINIFCEIPMVLSPTTPMNAGLANDLHMQTGVKGSALPPAVMADLAKNPEYLENLSRLDYITTGGQRAQQRAAKSTLRYAAAALSYSILSNQLSSA
ncbi:hypothetical protein MMC25_007315 [Agyrium rufum]|nr:hypothetical protein [Agyrium rufum]